MKPPDSFIKYLQAHPAVWEALHREWEEDEGDWFIAVTAYEEVQGDDWPCVDIEVGELNCIHSAYRIDDDGKAPKDVGRWIPMLRQILGMLVQEIHNRADYLSLGPTHINIAYSILEKTWDASVEQQDGNQQYLLWLGEVVLSAIGVDRTEPEIACTALWAKVKGVE